MAFIDTVSTAPLQTHYPGSATPGISVPRNLLLGKNNSFPPRYHPWVWVLLPNQDTLPLPHSKIQDAEERKRLTSEAGKGHHPG